MERLQAALEDLEDLGATRRYLIYWVFQGSRQARYSWWTCEEIAESLSWDAYMAFQRTIDYRRDR